MRVVVVGAGPGGATAALELSRAGAEVWLVEKSAWPRDKTCGDGISPLGVREGNELRLRFEGRVRLHRALVTTPGEVSFRGGWPADAPWGTTVERREFDGRIVAAAVEAGTQFFPSTIVRSVESRPGGVVATLLSGEKERTVRADVAIIGEGATGGLASRLGFAPHRSRLIAVRGYAEVARTLEPEYGIFYDRMVTPGYGWIFPLDDRRANVGILVDERTLARAGGNMRGLFERWLRESRFSRTLLGESPRIRGVRGGVIPSGRRTRTCPRIFLVGDAAGVADPFTAEGIFQAVSSARLAARALIASEDVFVARERYERDAKVFDRNERAARGLRFTFAAAIGIYARHAAKRSAFADHLNTAVFFPKTSFYSFVWDLVRTW